MNQELQFQVQDINWIDMMPLEGNLMQVSADKKNFSPHKSQQMPSSSDPGRDTEN